MIKRIKTLSTLSDYQLRVQFDDGRVVLYNVKEDIDQIPSYTPLKTLVGLFPQAKLDESRTCVYWNEDIDLPSDAIYEYGKELAPAFA